MSNTACSLAIIASAMGRSMSVSMSVDPVPSDVSQVFKQGSDVHVKCQATGHKTVNPF